MRPHPENAMVLTEAMEQNIRTCIEPSARGSAVAYPGQGTLETRHCEGSTGLLCRKYRGKKTKSLIHIHIMVP